MRALWRSPWPWLLLWLASRVWTWQDWSEHWTHIANDVRYYFGNLSNPALGDQRLVEYPVPVVWFLDILRILGPDQHSYLVVFALAMALLDLGLTYALWRTGRMEAVAFWIAFVHCYGSLVWFRYDMVPAMAVALAALWVTRHPRRAGAMVALGASLKLWPALLILPLVGRHRPGMARLQAFGVVGFTMALLAFAGGGFRRLLSPLTWQDDRGLQIEAIPATWLMWQHGQPEHFAWFVRFSQYNAFEIYGPGTETWLAIASALMALSVAIAVAMGVVVWRRGALPADVLTLCMVAVVAGMLVANKTFSPQYLIWLGAPLAVLLVESHRRMQWQAAVLGVVGLVVAALTRQVYPVRYGGLISNPGDTDDTVVLVVRNLLLVGLWLLSTTWAWYHLLRRPRARRPIAHKHWDEAEVVAHTTH
ncbi:glycosyltransferase family 87 protein [Aestuariimicrobium ganziense]|uniref:glycosyltransferase family 87 protein n=1 Tax=Aestuariimicrobium ganziense TaxID=2773677 RepID=UPI0019410EFD|nr:glycosyltransferase family 87 protein [Aestuariimicrobium ganziense]